MELNVLFDEMPEPTVIPSITNPRVTKFNYIISNQIVHDLPKDWDDDADYVIVCKSRKEEGWN